MGPCVHGDRNDPVRPASALLEQATPWQPGPGSAPIEQLTDREAEILQLLAARLSAREIAVVLRISSTAVSRHLDTIYRKLRIGPGRAAAARPHDSGSGPRDRGRLATGTTPPPVDARPGDGRYGLWGS